MAKRQVEKLRLVGLHEAAELLGISKAALSDRRRADTFPEPLAELRCGPIWDRSVIEEHLETFGPSNRRRWSLQRIGRHFESLES